MQWKLVLQCLASTRIGGRFTNKSGIGEIVRRETKYIQANIVKPMQKTWDYE